MTGDSNGDQDLFRRLLGASVRFADVIETPESGDHPHDPLVRPRPRNTVIDVAASAAYVGDCRAVMREMPAGCVQTCVTSPPYWGLRDYGVEGQLGLEATPELFVVAMVEVKP
jgi:hypothetical protein